MYKNENMKPIHKKKNNKTPIIECSLLDTH